MSTVKARRSTGALGLAAATYSAAGVAMLTSVLLTRSMVPDDFGSYRYVLTVVGLGAVVANLGFPYSTARMLTQRPLNQHPRLIAASVQLTVAVLVAGSALLAVSAAATWSSLEVAPLLLLAAALLWTTALQRHFTYVLRGAGRTGDIALQTLAPPVVLLVALGMHAWLGSAWSLTVVLLSTGVAYFAAHLWTATRLKLWGCRVLETERSGLLGEQRRTGVPIYQGALVSVGVAELIVVVGGAVVGGAAFAQFALALSLAAPLATLPAVFGMVHFRRFGKDAYLPREALASTAIRSGLLAFCGIIFGWLAFPFIFPSDYDTARAMFLCLGIVVTVHGLGDYLNQFLQAQGDGRRLQRAAYVVGAISALAGFATIPFVGVWGLVATKAAGSIAYGASMLTLTRRWSHAPR